MTKPRGDWRRRLQEAARLFESGDHRAAGERCRAILAANPEQPDALHILGLIAAAEGRGDQAIELLRRAIAGAPANAFTHNSLGNALREAGQESEAVAILRRAIELKPALADAHSNLSNALLNLGRPEEAEAACRRAIALDPRFAEAFANLGNALTAQGRHGEAVEASRRAIALAPELAGAHTNLGNALGHLGRHDEAEQAHRRAIALRPDLADAHLNLACSLLARGRLAEGWAEHEWRWRARSHRFPWRHDGLAPWRGEPIAQGTLLLWGEQGIGDELLHAGLVDEVLALAPRLTLECAPRLAPLFARSMAGIEVVPRRDPPHERTRAADVACHSPTGSLGRWLRRGFDDFTRRLPYLIADAARSAALRERYREHGDGPVIGISWRSRNTRFGGAKTLDLAGWAPILRLPGARFVDLQYGDTAAERAELRAALGVTIHRDPEVDSLVDLDGFAAQVAAMDLVITVSNTAAHMAGALGKPAWVLLPAGPGLLWYWFLERDDSPWYPSLRLFRQTRPGDWAPVVERVAAELVAGTDRTRSR